MIIGDLKRSPTSWSKLRTRDLFFAYRKAKADCYYERVLNVARGFAEYERDLPENLRRLLGRIKEGEIDRVFDENMGSLRIIAKKLAVKSGKCTENNLEDSHGYFSDPGLAFKRLCSTHELTPEFRLLSDFPVEMHIISALWINLVGHKFDAALGPSAYGSRLKRYRSRNKGISRGVEDFHLEAVGSFQRYFEPYKAWREDGMRAIRKELSSERKVIAISLDLTSYYHLLDPQFICNQNFLESANVHLSGWESDFTKSVARMLRNWSAEARKLLLEMGCKTEETIHGGVPIGLSMVRVIANSFLFDFDHDILRGLAPIYYGRYVDDIFLVLRDPENLNNSSDVFSYIGERTRYFPSRTNKADLPKIELEVPEKFRGDSVLLLQPSKQKLFFLQGQGGLDLLDNIESQIRSVSSERRLMPAPGRLESMASAQVLTAANLASEEADTFRRADGLSVRRLGWALQLRAVEILARDLQASDWRLERTRFYRFALDHIVRPDRIMDQIDYLPRLTSLAVSLGDWGEANRLLEASLAAIDELSETEAVCAVKLNGWEVGRGLGRLWKGVKDSIRESTAEAVLKSLPCDDWSHGDSTNIPGAMRRLFTSLGLPEDPSELSALKLLIREADLARVSYKDHLRLDARMQRAAVRGEDRLHRAYPMLEDLERFIQNSDRAAVSTGAPRVNPYCERPAEGRAVSLLPYLFPTRPYNAMEISLFLPNECIFGDENTVTSNWAKYYSAVRGVWVRPSMELSVPTAACDELPKRAVIGGRGELREIRLGISSLRTEELSFSRSASGRADLSPERYRRLETVVNQAIRAWPKPTYLLLPELSLPDRWVDTVSKLLQEAEIGLIAGLDYTVVGDQIHSEAVLILSDHRLGFPSLVQIRQQKSVPAPGEEEQLLKIFGKSWNSSEKASPRPVYWHGGFAFGVVICSELQNLKYRSEFQGQLDCLMVLSWNRDLETFSALVEATSLDVHAYVALVNNRLYGDSRVRSPAKHSYNSDLCRLRGGENDHLAVVKLDIEALRSFQSRAKRWPADGDKFKPVPEGFAIDPGRRLLPK